jgi:hypothetical protein
MYSDFPHSTTIVGIWFCMSKQIGIGEMHAGEGLTVFCCLHLKLDFFFSTMHLTDIYLQIFV